MVSASWLLNYKLKKETSELTNRVTSKDLKSWSDHIIDKAPKTPELKIKCSYLILVGSKSEDELVSGLDANNIK
ncbi:27855_t:CDS:2, partial [Racocetra persica]